MAFFQAPTHPRLSLAYISHHPGLFHLFPGLSHPSPWTSSNPRAYLIPLPGLPHPSPWPTSSFPPTYIIPPTDNLCTYPCQPHPSAWPTSSSPFSQPQYSPLVNLTLPTGLPCVSLWPTSTLQLPYLIPPLSILCTYPKPTSPSGITCPSP
jgi:hypothetical protein